MGKRVLVVDLDPQANLTLSLGIDSDQKVLSLSQSIPGKEAC